MYAIVEIGGQQFKVEEGKKIFVNRLEAGESSEVTFDKVLLIDDEGKITIGAPVISDAVIEGKIVDHVRADKVIVFKKKRKKGYRVRNGHRQDLTRVEIVSINGTSGKKSKKEASGDVTEKKATRKKPVTDEKQSEE